MSFSNKSLIDFLKREEWIHWGSSLDWSGVGVSKFFICQVKNEIFQD
jgi:hypothetical protein